MAKLQKVVEEAHSELRDCAQQCIDTVQAIGINSFGDLLGIAENKSLSLEIRQSACWLLLRLGEHRATSALLEIATDIHEEIEMRRYALYSVGQIGSRQAIKPLATLMNEDPSEEIRASATNALGWLSVKLSLSSRFLYRLLSHRKIAEVLIEKLNDTTETPNVRGEAAEALANGCFTETVPSLINALGDPSAEVRFWSAFALGQVGSPAAIPALERLAADEAIVPGWWSVGKEANDALVTIKNIC
ncbi:MAG: HEAT repeat domain-containing protein [Anaerolineae bacterium]|nr:HEAT repeat domain-containing protein [Anaerolineae bacterium]